MRKIFIPFFATALLFSCKDTRKAYNEDFYAIGYDGRDHEIAIADSLVLDIPKLKSIVFLYHDSIFKLEIDHNNTERYSLLKSNKSSRHALISTFNSYRKTTLKAQLKEIQEHGIKHGCYTDGYFLFRKNNQLQFGLFEFQKYYDWYLHNLPDEIPLKSKQFPQIYLVIYHTFNSKWREYYFSNEYHYKQLRVHTRIPEN